MWEYHQEEQRVAEILFPEEQCAKCIEIPATSLQELRYNWEKAEFISVKTVPGTAEYPKYDRTVFILYILITGEFNWLELIWNKMKMNFKCSVLISF